FNPKIGYPDKWIDYSSVEVAPGAHWQNVVAASRFKVDGALPLIGKPLDRGRWGMTPPTSNAYYNPQLNEIVFPAGILRPPGFDPTAVAAANYCASGGVLAAQPTPLPGRPPAAAGLRPHSRRRGQLRLDRRRHRPRGEPRLRRRGRAV